MLVSECQEKAINQPQPTNAAETYEHYFVPAMFLPWATLLLGHAALRSGERVLDVACGTGIVAHQAAPLVGTGGQVVALDMNPAKLAVARTLSAPPGAAVQGTPVFSWFSSLSSFRGPNAWAPVGKTYEK